MNWSIKNIAIGTVVFIWGVPGGIAGFAGVGGAPDESSANVISYDMQAAKKAAAGFGKAFVGTVGDNWFGNSVAMSNTFIAEIAGVGVGSGEYLWDLGKKAFTHESGEIVPGRPADKPHAGKAKALTK